MNMISTVPFYGEMDEVKSQSDLVGKLTAAWEKKNSKAARAGGVSLMALSLAACGGSDDTPFSQVDLDTALTDASGTKHATVDAAITSNDVTIAAGVDITTDNQAAIDEAVAAVDLTTDNAAAVTAGLKAAADDLGITGTSSMTDAQLVEAIKTANDTAVANAVDTSADDAAAINAAVAADTSFANLAELVAAYDALANPTASGMTLTASTTDTATGDGSDNTITGNQVTFDNTDTITGGLGTDTLAITNTAAGTYVPGLLAGVENIQMTSFAASSIDLVTATGVEKVVSLNSSAADTFSNLQTLASVEVDGKSGATTAGIVTVTYDDSLAGATATVAVELKGGSAVTQLSVGGNDASFTEFGTIAITSSGSSANSLTLIEDANSAAVGDLTTVSVVGAGDLTLGTGTSGLAGNNTAADMTLNAGDATGDLTVTGTNFENVTLGSGDDTLYLAATQVSAATDGDDQVVLNGGAGTNTLVFGEQDLSDTGLLNNTAAGTTDDTITNFQTLTFGAALANGATADLARAIDADAISGATVIKFEAENNDTNAGGAGGEDVSVTVSDIVSGQTIKGSFLASATATNDEAVVLDMASPTASTDAITFESVASSATTAHVNSISSLTVNQTTVSGTAESVETFNLVASRADVSTADGTQISALAAGSTTTLNISGAQDATIGTVELNDSSTADSTVAVVNASDLTGNLTLGSASADFQATNADDITVTLGSGTNTVYGGTALDVGDTITGGGTDTVHLTAGAGKVNLSNIDVVAITGASATSSAENWSSIGYVDVTNGSKSSNLTNLANGTLVKSDDIDSAKTLRADLATGGTEISIELDTTTASQGTFDTNATDLTINHSAVDANGDYADNALIVSADVTSVTLTGGGETSSAGTNSAFTLANGGNATITSISSSYDGSLDVSSASTFNATSGATVTTGSTSNAATTTTSQAAVTNGLVHFNDTAGTDTLTFTSTGGDVGVMNVDGYETIDISDLDMATTTSFAMNLRDSAGVTQLNITGATNGDIDSGVTISNASSTMTLAVQTAFGDGADTMSITAASGASDTLTITTDGGNFSSGHADAAVTVSGYETVNIAGGLDDDIDLGTADALLTLTGATTVNIGGDTVAATDSSVVTLGTVAATSTETLTLTAEGGNNSVADLGTMNSLETLTLTAATGVGNTITAGTSTSVDTITITGAGSNTITALTSASLDTISGGDATGAITLGSASAALTSASGASFTTGTGDDSITMSAQALRALNAGEATGDSDTLVIVGTQNSGTSVIDLNATGDQVSNVNGFADAIVQTGFENVDASAVTTTGTFGYSITANAAGSVISGGQGNDTITLGDGADDVAILATNGVDTITGFTAATDDIDISAITASSAFDATIDVSDSGTADTLTAGQIYFVTGASAGDADTAAAAATEITASGNWTAATNGHVAYFVVVDDNSTGIFKFVEAADNEVAAGELTLVSSFDAVAAAATDFIF